MFKNTHITLKFVLLVILFFASLFMFLYIDNETLREKEDGFDINVIAFRVAHIGAGLITVMKIITFFGSMWFLIGAYIILIAFFIYKKNYRYSIVIAIIPLGAIGISILFKELFHRTRPELPLITRLTDYSFPSGHAFSSFVFCSILAYLVWHRIVQPIWKWLISALLLFFTLLIGMSRIVLNVHFATDVIGGFSLGIMWMILMYAIFQKWLINEKAWIPSPTSKEGIME
jgi:membrane-associated phospholipid phosphatase